ncbi:transposase [Actinacidiphila glaucinigra]|uniref:transposase n=1 Tax=Actinacidiphila glaucinigra TaxID=235986 RepID=UPI003720FE87
MGRKYTKRYTEEFKRDAIALVDSPGKTVTAVARGLGISSESLRDWYRRAKADAGEGKPRFSRSPTRIPALGCSPVRARQDVRRGASYALSLLSRSE